MLHAASAASSRRRQARPRHRRRRRCDCRRARSACSSAACASVPALATKAIRSYRLGLVIGHDELNVGAGCRAALVYTPWPRACRDGPAETDCPERRGKGLPAGDAAIFLQRPDRIPILSRRILGQFPRALAKQRGAAGRCSAERPKHRRGKLEFAGAPVRKAFGVIPDQCLLGRRKLDPTAPATGRSSAPGLRPLTRTASSSRQAKASPASATVASEAMMVVP